MEATTTPFAQAPLHGAQSSSMQTSSSDETRNIETVEKILMAVEGRQQEVAESTQHVFNTSDTTTSLSPPDMTSKSLESIAGGPLSSSELSTLVFLCASMDPKTCSNSRTNSIQTKEGWANLDAESLTTLTSCLEKHVISASHIDMMKETHKYLEEHPDVGSLDQWLLAHPVRGHGSERIAILTNGLNACDVILAIMTTPGIDQRVVSEDAIEACISLTRQHLLKHIVPFLSGNPSLPHDSSSSEGKYSRNSPTKRRKLKQELSGAQIQKYSKCVKKLFKPILSTVGLIGIVMERLEKLVRTVEIDDSPLLMISSASLATFTVHVASGQASNVSMCHLVQTASVALIASIFQRYPRHRTIITEDLFPLMLQLPTSKRSLRTYPVRGLEQRVGQKADSASQSHIQVLTALVLTLVHRSAVMPTVVPPPQDRDGASPSLSNGLRDCQFFCDFFASEMVKRCARKGEDGGASEFRPILANLTDDLLLVLLNPEYPGAEMLLMTLCRKLSSDLMQASSIGGKKSSGAQVFSENTYLATAMDILGKIASNIAGLLVTERSDPMKISEQDKGGQAASNVEDGNQCFCGRSRLVDTFMLDCDKCHSWFHGSCVGVTKDKLPSLWLCDDCSLQATMQEQSKAFLTYSRIPRFSDANSQDPDEGLELSEQDGTALVKVEESYVFRQIVLNYLSQMAIANRADSVYNTRHFFLAKCLYDLERDQNKNIHTDDKLNEKHYDNGLKTPCLSSFFLDQWFLPGEKSSKGIAVDTSFCNPSTYRHYLTEEGNTKVLRTLASTKWDVFVSFPRLMGVLVALMGDDGMVVLRKLAIKAMLQVVQADPTLMKQPNLRKAVSRRLVDESISVREAAVSLVGSYVVKSPEVAAVFHPSLLSCLRDSGVSVRKRAIRIFRDAMIANPSYKGRSSVCAEMLRCAANPKEDDGVRDLIHDTFEEMWFDAGSRHTAVSPCAAPTNVKGVIPSIDKKSPAGNAACVTPGKGKGTDSISPLSTGELMSPTPLKNENTLNTKYRIHASQMVDVVSNLEKGEFLSTLLKGFVSEVAENTKERKKNERRKRQEQARRECRFLVSALIEQLLALEESRSANDPKAGDRLVALISTVNVFADAVPEVLLTHVDTLLPYFKADNGLSMESEARLITSVCRTMSAVTPLLGDKAVKEIGDGSISDDLMKITYKFGSGASSAAVEVLSRLAQHRASGEESIPHTSLMKLATTFYGLLYSKSNLADDFSTVKGPIGSHVQRALSVLGSICRHRDAGGVQEKWDDLADCDLLKPSSLSWATLLKASYGICMIFLSKKDSRTKSAALRAITGIFISKPRMMLTDKNRRMMSEIVSDPTPPEVQLEALRCWRTILIEEEHRIESGEAKKRMDSKKDITVSKKISGDQDGDASLVGGVLSQFAPRFYQLTKSRHPELRYGAVDLIGNLLRQGMMNPMESVPHLFAVQGDVKSPMTRSLALKLLITEAEKRPDMLRQRMRAGIIRAFEFQVQVYPDSEEVTALVTRKHGRNLNVECIFDQIFKESIRSSRVQREGLYKSLLSLFEGDNRLSGTKKAAKKGSVEMEGVNLRLLSFAAQVLAHLPYASASDPLFIIYQIAGTTTLRGAQLIEQLASLVRPYGIANEDEHDDQNSSEDALEKVSKSKNPSRSNVASKMFSDPNFELQKFQRLCHESSALVLLLRLKQFLRKTYSLSEMRCLEYTPGGKEKIHDRGISTPDHIPLFDAKIENASKESKPNTGIFKDALIRQYAEFRRLMRRVDGDGMKSGGSGDEAVTPKPRKRAKRKASQIADSDDDSDYEN